MEFLDPSKVTELAKIPFSTWFIYAAIGIGTAIAAAIAYLRGKTEQSLPTPNMVIREGSIADMQPVREMAVLLKDLTATAKAIETLLRTEVVRKRKEEVNDLKEENIAMKLELQAMKRRRERMGD